jgi:hypothetical protein
MALLLHGHGMPPFSRLLTLNHGRSVVEPCGGTAFNLPGPIVFAVINVK